LNAGDNVCLTRAKRGSAAFLLLLACCAFAAAPSTPPPAPALEILHRDRDDPHLLAWRTFDATGKPLDNVVFHAPPVSPDGERELTAFSQRVPLGSLWKLFVYLWLVEEHHPAPDYVCTGPQGNSAAERKIREEELYCCESGQRGQSIDRDTALLRSCALFFDPARLAIDPLAWRKFWQGRFTPDASWLAELAAMRPETEVSPASLIHALEAAPPRARQEAADVLLTRVFTPAAGTALDTTALTRHVGGQLRIKTFSWHLADGLPYGGGAGWFADGMPVWFAGRGTGQQVMARHGATLGSALAEVLPAESENSANSEKSAARTPGCVEVNFFARYPFTLIHPNGKPVDKAGVLRGPYVARFSDKIAVPFTANGELTFSISDKGKQSLIGRFGIDDYVARVIGREGDPSETEAAKALAVVARSYLLNEAKKSGNCLSIDDSTRAQRVSINPPGPAARAITDFTTGLVLRGAPVGYHYDTPAKNRMAWTQAVAASRAGEPWDIILRQALPKASLTAMSDPAGTPCQRFTQAESWLTARAPRWQRYLSQNLAGFEAPDPPQICRLSRGTPFSEQERGRIHLRELKTAEDRLTLAHEYLHLGLRHHPSGHDEALVEHWARELSRESVDMQ
jgi:uncharacterized protein YfaQ (DUF2300 family)